MRLTSAVHHPRVFILHSLSIFQCMPTNLRLVLLMCIYVTLPFSAHAEDSILYKSYWRSAGKALAVASLAEHANLQQECKHSKRLVHPYASELWATKVKPTVVKLANRVGISQKALTSDLSIIEAGLREDGDIRMETKKHYESLVKTISAREPRYCFTLHSNVQPFISKAVEEFEFLHQKVLEDLK